MQVSTGALPKCPLKHGQACKLKRSCMALQTSTRRGTQACTPIVCMPDDIVSQHVWDYRYSVRLRLCLMGKMPMMPSQMRTGEPRILLLCLRRLLSDTPNIDSQCLLVQACAYWRDNADEAKLCSCSALLSFLLCCCFCFVVSTMPGHSAVLIAS